MGIKSYSVSLEEEVVEKAKELWKKSHYGSKLSPLINHLLEKWCDEENKRWGQR